MLLALQNWADTNGLTNELSHESTHGAHLAQLQPKEMTLSLCCSGAGGRGGGVFSEGKGGSVNSEGTSWELQELA